MKMKQISMMGLMCLPLLSGCESWFVDKKPLEGVRESIFQSQQVHKKTGTPQAVILDAPVLVSQLDNFGGNKARLMSHALLGNKIRLDQEINVDSNNGKALLTPPLILNDQLIILDSLNELKAYDFNSGEKLWSLDLIPESRNDREATFGGGIAHHQGILYVAVSLGEVVAVSLEKKEILWRRPTFGPCRGAPVVEKGHVYVVTVTNKTIAYDAATGQQVWMHEGAPEVASVAVPSSPASSGAAILSPYSSGELVALKPNNGMLLWAKSLGVNGSLTNKIFAHLTANPVIKDDMVYVGSLNNDFEKISLNTGELIWKAPVASIGLPVLSGNAVFLTTSKGTIVALSQVTGDVIWETQLETKNPGLFDRPIHWLPPALGSGKLYVANTQQELFVFDAIKGTILNKISLPATVTVQPMVVKNTLVLLTHEGQLLMYR